MAETLTPGDQAPPEEGKGEDSQPSWWAEAQKRGFRSQDDVWKSYTEAERKISEQGEALANARRLEEQVTPVLEAIWSDPELLKQLKTRLDGKNPPEETSSKGSNPPASQSLADEQARSILRLQAIEKFETSRGIDKLDSETAKEIKGKLGAKLAQWGMSIDKVPIEALPSVLDDAFIALSGKDEGIKKLVSNVGIRSSGAGEFPSTSSVGGGEEEIVLTPEQRKVAEHTPGGIDAYIKSLKKIREGK